jgi:hypothetical protein
MKSVTTIGRGNRKTNIGGVVHVRKMTGRRIRRVRTKITGVDKPGFVGLGTG